MTTEAEEPVAEAEAPAAEQEAPASVDEASASVDEPRLTRTERRRAEREQESAIDWIRGLFEGVPVKNVALFACAVLLLSLLGAAIAGRGDSGDKAREKLVKAFRDNLHAVSSLNYGDLDGTIRNATPHMVDPYKARYLAQMDALRSQSLPPTITVDGQAGMVGIDVVSDGGTNAVALIYGKQTIANTAVGQQPTTEVLTLVVSMAKVDGDWKIYDIQPI